MSHVYRSRDTVIGRTVAVKILTEAGCEDAEAKARFLAEARMAGNIAHDNVISIYDFGEDDQGRPFMVMEFLRGEDLRHAIRDGHTGDLKTKLTIALQVARALQYIHTQKIIHRDIKPENVHITAAGAVKLMDFGISKTEGLSMTRAGYVLGTPYYMSPEQVTGQNVTEQVDVYAFGVLLFELMTGVKPISGDTVERIFYSILNEPLNLQPMYDAGVPQGICDVVAKCTAKSPAERPQGFDPVCAELERMVAELSAPALQIVARGPEAKPSKAPWIVAAVAVLALLLGAGAYLAFRPKAPAFAKSIATPTGEMVLVPAGPFLYGADRQSVTLPAFYIDKTEVPNAAYAKFCSDTKRQLPADFPQDKPDFPVVSVSILDARDFAAWAGKRLPNAREWEKAARGENGQAFPWGGDLDASRANVGIGQPMPVVAFPKGASPYGALQMVGNVWEFVNELSKPSEQAIGAFSKSMQPPPGPEEPWYMIRGGAYDFRELRPELTWDSTTVPARWKFANIGFRCAKDATERN